MARFDQRFYIKIPVTRQGKTVAEYLPVDPADLHIGLLTTLYSKGAPNCVAKESDEYLPAYGAEALVNVALDPSVVLQELEERAGEVFDTLTSIGPEGERCAALFRELKLEGLIKAVASCDLERGREAVRHVMYTLMGSLSEIASDLQTHQNSVRNLERTTSQCFEVINEDGRLEDVYLKWAEAVEDVNRSSESVLGVEQDISEFIGRVKTAASSWEGILKGEGTEIRDIKDFLEPDEGAEGFIVRALLFRHEGADPERMRLDVEQATSYLARCDELERKVRDQYDVLNAEYHRRLVGSDPESMKAILDLRLKELSRAQAALRTCEEAYGSYPKPYQAKEALVTEEQYVSAIGRLPSADTSQHPWRVGSRRFRIGDTIGLCSVLLSARPRLPQKLLDAVEQARVVIREVELLGRLEASVGHPSEDAQGRSAEAQVRVEIPREEELYELCLCIGYVQSLPSSEMPSLTTQIFRRILLILDLTCEIEMSQSSRPFTERIVAGSETVEDLETVPLRRRESDKDWIRFRMRDGGMRSMITMAGAERAPHLMRKYGVTERSVIEAYRRMRQ